jgi:hypothetical protein
MAADDLTRFRTLCGHYRWLAVFMVVSVGALLALMYFVAPAILAVRGDYRGTTPDWLGALAWGSPALFYLYAVWSLGQAMGRLAKGDLIQPTLARALRRVGLALGIGGMLSVFGVTNLVRILQGGHGGWLHFDVSSMTLGMIGGALFLLGRVLDQATAVQAELDEMI